MINIVAQYIKTCHVCKRTKIYRDDEHKLLRFLLILKRYFQNISMNFIISLLVCKRYDKSYEHIMIVVNKLFKKKRFMTLNSFNVNIVIQTFVKWVWKEENYSMMIVFDKDTQFISHFWRRLCERIDTTFKLSIAWHSKTNDQTKNANENLKAYFRAYVSYNQNEWVNYLFMIEFEVNFVKSNFKKIESFLATKKYLLKLNIESFIFIIANSMTRKKMKNVDKLIEKFEILRIYLREKLKWAQNKMKKQINRDRHLTSKFRVNDTIMLNVRFQKITRFNESLNYKNLNFFKIAKIYHKNNVYKLNLLATMKNIFLVFHS